MKTIKIGDLNLQIEDGLELQITDGGKSITIRMAPPLQFLAPFSQPIQIQPWTIPGTYPAFPVGPYIGDPFPYHTVTCGGAGTASSVPM